MLPYITGWVGTTALEYGDTMEYTITKSDTDLYYLKHRASRWTVHIAFHTAKVMLMRRARSNQQWSMPL